MKQCVGQIAGSLSSRHLLPGFPGTCHLVLFLIGSKVERGLKAVFSKVGHGPPDGTIEAKLIQSDHLTDTRRGGTVRAKLGGTNTSERCLVQLNSSEVYT